MYSILVSMLKGKTRDEKIDIIALLYSGGSRLSFYLEHSIYAACEVEVCVKFLWVKNK